jgi:hypothetical protein
VQFLPIIEREFRVAARQPRTWWRRVLTTGAALVVFAFVILVIGQRLNPNLVGSSLFKALSLVGFFYAR